MRRENRFWCLVAGVWCLVPSAWFFLSGEVLHFEWMPLEFKKRSGVNSRRICLIKILGFICTRIVLCLPVADRGLQNPS